VDEIERFVGLVFEKIAISKGLVAKALWSTKIPLPELPKRIRRMHKLTGALTGPRKELAASATRSITNRAASLRKYEYLRGVKTELARSRRTQG